MGSRHHDVEYIPLDSSPIEPTATHRSFSPAKYAGRLFFAAAFFAGILVGEWIGRSSTLPNVIKTLIPSPVTSTIFDAFVDINHASPVRYPESTMTKRNERAVVTSLYTESYAVAVATLGHALTKVGADARKVVMYLPERISPASLCYLREVGWELYPIDLIEQLDHGKGIRPNFIDQYTKLRIWTLDMIGIKAAVYLDADTLVKRNFDELFELPFIFAATPEVYTDGRGFAINFDAGLMAFKPNSKVFADMLSKVESAHFDRTAAEQSYLNLYYGSQVLRLPHVYNGNLAIKWKAGRYWTAMQEQLRVIHFTLIKPFDDAIKCASDVCTDREVFDMNRRKDFLEIAEKSWGGAFKDEVREWGVVFEEMMKRVGYKCLL